MSCKDRLEKYLTDEKVAFDMHRRGRVVTAQEVAEADHLPGRMVAKTVMVVAGGELAMLVVPAPYQVDLAKAAAVLRDPSTRLAREQEFVDRFPGCEVGAMPAFGNLYGVPVHVDASLGLNERIATQAGNHQDLLVLRYDDFVRLVQPSIDDLTGAA